MYKKMKWAIVCFSIVMANSALGKILPKTLGFNAPQVWDKTNDRAANTGDIVFDLSDQKYWGFVGGSTWESLSGVSATNIQSNFGLAASVSSNNLNVTLTDSSGANCSSTSACLFSFRSPTATNGTMVQQTVTSALSLTVPS